MVSEPNTPGEAKTPGSVGLPDRPGEPPDFREINPMMLNERELSEIHQKLADWVDQAEEANDSDRPLEQLIDDVRNALSAISEERAHRRTM